MRSYMRTKTVVGEADAELARAVGMSGGEIEEMYRLLAIADYGDRFVVPAAHRELAEELSQQNQGACGLDFPGGPGACAPEASASGNGHRADAPLVVTKVGAGQRAGALARLQERRARERAARRQARREQTA